MNNIEILEKAIKVLTGNDIGIKLDFENTAKAIENLIQENKELEEKNKILESLLQGNLFKMYKYYKELCSSYQGNSISKDKVKEKIEELERQKQNVLHEVDFKAFYRITDLKNIEIGILKQLLEEGE